MAVEAEFGKVLINEVAMCVGRADRMAITHQ
jgi:hypothetical protein